METRPRLLLPVLFVLTAIAAPLPDLRAQATPDATSKAGKSAEAASTLPEAPLAEFRSQLLEVAFEAASALPLQPHVKNRSRAQEWVVEACLQLDQPGRALRYAQSIANWRRGAGLADYAHYCAETGHPEEANRWIPEAAAVARTQEETDEDSDAQAWRRDRIRARLAETLRLLGRIEEAAPFEEGLEASEAGAIEAARARQLPANDFEAVLARLDEAARVGNMDQVRNALTVCVEFSGRFYGDEKKREAAVEIVREHRNKLPAKEYLVLLEQLSAQCREHDDLARAIAWADEAAELVADEMTWEPDYRIPMVASVVAMRAACGQPEIALTEADSAFARYLEQRDSIVDVFRVEALVPLAEAIMKVGKPESARRVYLQALREAVVNPNSRPRAMDLALICSSMAVQGLEPDEETWSHVRKARKSLGEPW